MASQRIGGNQRIPRPEVWASHHDAPWPHGSTWSLADLVDAVPSAPQPVRPEFAQARVSAVLVALCEGVGGVEVLLTRRSMQLRNHRGEICFPGGRLDAGESPVDTALREAHEEVDLDPAAARIVGELGHLETVVSRSYIVPVVAVLGERPRLAAQTAEVDRVLWAPLEEFSRPGTYRFERWGDPPQAHDLHFFELDDETVWGATAKMIVELLTLRDQPGGSATPTRR